MSDLDSEMGTKTTNNNNRGKEYAPSYLLDEHDGANKVPIVIMPPLRWSQRLLTIQPYSYCFRVTENRCLVDSDLDNG